MSEQMSSEIVYLASVWRDIELTGNLLDLGRFGILDCRVVYRFEIVLF